ncbi:MAG TPA: septum formation initiator family protein [Gammaproteobacteria bacterium]|nr:septum formation initiator family protein [Gammaproteobacteria bacterium]
MKFSRFNLWIFLLFGVLVFFQYRLWIGPGSIREMSQLKKQLAVEQSKNDKLKQRNELVRLQVQQLQKNQDAIESRARQELGMIKKDETFYQIVK